MQVRVRGGKHRVDSKNRPYSEEIAIHAETYTKAYEVMQSLHETMRATIDSTMYYWIAAKHSPSSLGRDQSGRDIYVINFDVMKEYE